MDRTTDAMVSAFPSNGRLFWRIVVTAAVLNALYITTYLGNPMSKSILDLTVSLVDHQSLTIDPYAGNSTDVARYDLHYYSGMPPGASLVCVPYYVIAKTWLWAVVTPEREMYFDEAFLTGGAAWMPSEKHLTIVLLNVFICLFGCSVLAGFMAAFFYRALVQLYPDLGEGKRLATTALFAFGTIWFIYSPGIYHRTLSTFLCFSAWLLAFLPEPESPALRRGRGLLFGALLGLAMATTYEIAIVVALIVVYTFVRFRFRWPWLGTSAGAAIFLALLAGYHTACFGVPWETAYEYRIEESVVPPMFEEVADRGWMSQFSRAVGFLFGTDYGVFFYSPPLLLALGALLHVRKRRSHRGVIVFAFSVLIALLAFHFVTGYDGLPGEFGFRMMIPAIPFLMLLAPLTYGWAWRRIVPALAVASAVIVGKGVMYGVHAGRPFWRGYPEFIHRYGLANYTLANLKDHLWAGFSPWAITAIHLGLLGGMMALLWMLVWKPWVKRNLTSPRAGV